MASKKTKIGIIGCGNISSFYLKNLVKSNDVEVVACSDLLADRAKALASKFNIPKTCTSEQLLADSKIQIILNLTIPAVHAEVSLAALEAGKHVYSEKPLAANLQDARKILDVAKAEKLAVGCAPDTFFGGPFQACRKLIDEGRIGKPMAATAFMMALPPETWHPDPEFLYQPGAGPMLDMGPYYLTTLINLLGPVKSVTGMTETPFQERTISSEAKKGRKFKVNTPTYIVGQMEFKCGALATLITTFDVWASDLPFIEVYGTEGTLSLPDPNGFGGTAKAYYSSDDKWIEIPPANNYLDNERGLGLIDMACSLQKGGAYRANGQVAYHVLEIMHTFQKSAKDHKYIDLASTCNRPDPV